MKNGDLLENGSLGEPLLEGVDDGHEAKYEKHQFPLVKWNIQVPFLFLDDPRDSLERSDSEPEIQSK